MHSIPVVVLFVAIIGPVILLPALNTIEKQSDASMYCSI